MILAEPGQNVSLNIVDLKKRLRDRYWLWRLRRAALRGGSRS
jgi:hypothetical protein